jgi:hypothetical protein
LAASTTTRPVGGAHIARADGRGWVDDHGGQALFGHHLLDQPFGHHLAALVDAGGLFRRGRMVSSDTPPSSGSSVATLEV